MSKSTPVNPLDFIADFEWPEEDNPSLSPGSEPDCDSDSDSSRDGEETKVTKARDRKFCAILYPEDPTHVAAMEKIKEGGFRYAAILHNEDVYETGEHKGEKKKEHWHLVLQFPNAVWNTSLAKQLGIGANYFQVCKNIEGALLYLIHFGCESTKHQYEVSEVFGPLQQMIITLLQDQDEGTKVLHIVDIIRDHPGPIGYTELIRKAVAAGLWSDLRRMGTFATGLIREHNEPFYRNEWEQTSNALDRERFRIEHKAFRGEY